MADLKAKLNAKLKALDEMEDMLDRVDADSVRKLKPSSSKSDDPSAVGQDKSPPENGEEIEVDDKGDGSGETDAEDFDENSDSLPVRQMAAMKKAANRGAGGGRPTKLSK